MSSLKTQPWKPNRILTQVLYRTLSQKDGRSVGNLVEHVSDEPTELSTHTSAPGVLKVFGDRVCMGAHYKSVLATPSSSARELVREALLRYCLSRATAADYVLCDVIGRLEGPGRQWQPECLRVLGDDEKPLLLQDLWRPKDGFARRLELRRRAEVEDLATKEKDTITAGINAQARRLQRVRAKGTPVLSMELNRSLSETSLEVAAGVVSDSQRPYLTLPGPSRSPSHKKEKEDGLRLSLYQAPHLLLLQGYNQQKDCLVYLLNRDQHTVGQETASVRPSICLLAPDILPLHCTIRRIQTKECLAVEAVLHATVLVNFSPAERSQPLRHGDLLSFGTHYVFLYKDPLAAETLPSRTLLHMRALQPSRPTCRACGNPIGERTFVCQTRANPSSKDSQKRRLHLEFEENHTDLLVERIVTLVEPGGDEHRLTPAYLLCLCAEHAAAVFERGSFINLLMKIAKKIQAAAWDKMTESLGTPAQHQDVDSQLLIPTLRPLFFWMSNATEVLYFLQQRLPKYVKCLEQRNPIDTKEKAASAACEESMAILEDVIVYTFQQSVYHITKSLYKSLLALLDGSASEAMFRVLQVYQSTQSLLQHCQIHAELQSQLFAYLFFFSNASLLNHLLSKGPTRGWFQQACGVQLKASLKLLLDWTHKAGLYRLAERFFAKFHCAVAMVATPPHQLAQMSWTALCVRHPALKPAQLHHILTQCQLEAGSTPVSLRLPEEELTRAPVDVLESFDDHPPIVLPSGGFTMDLDSDAVDNSIYRQLLYVRHFLWGLRSRKEPQVEQPKSFSYPERSVIKVASLTGPQHSPEEAEPHTGLYVVSQSQRSSQSPDTSCLLTPPTTPSNPDTKIQVNGGTDPPAFKGINGLVSCEVELDKGPFGLGLGLIDGMQTALRSPGIFIRTLVPGGPAASDGRLRIGDRILAVNGTDVTAADYQSAVDLIRWGGDRLHLLVQKTDTEGSEMISASLC